MAFYVNIERLVQILMESRGYPQIEARLIRDRLKYAQMNYEGGGKCSLDHAILVAQDAGYPLTAEEMAAIGAEFTDND